MTTFIDFIPPADVPFQFQPSLDGVTYNVSVTWNLFGQRWYANIYTVQGVLIVSLPMIGSPPSYDISLTAGYFATKLIFRQADNRFEII